jgi:predicted RNA binding protein YcfA (HicA-like mRNA interferase family)
MAATASTHPSPAIGRSALSRFDFLLARRIISYAGWRMNKAEKVKLRLLAGQGYHNFAFSDLQLLLKSLGFRLDRQEGSHQAWRHSIIPQAVNIQSVHGQCKPYQLRQIRDIIKEHNL